MMRNWQPLFNACWNSTDLRLDYRRSRWLAAAAVLFALSTWGVARSSGLDLAQSLFLAAVLGMELHRYLVDRSSYWQGVAVLALECRAGRWWLQLADGNQAEVELRPGGLSGRYFMALRLRPCGGGAAVVLVFSAFHLSRQQRRRLAVLLRYPPSAYAPV
jgi:hypothetical protein